VDHYNSRGDIDGGIIGGPGVVPFQVQTASRLTDLSQWSQEFRVESKNAGPMNWQAGLYYFDEDATGGSDNFDSVTQAQTSRVISNQKNKAWAAFGSVTYAVNDAFTLRGGLRYTDDKKDFATLEHSNVTLIGPAGISESKSKVNWDLSGTYKLNRDVNLYARAATGFRAPSIAAASASVPVTVADAETVTSFEVGLKSDLFERRARANFSLYDFEVKNQQLTVVGGNSNVTKLINAAKTKAQGAEFDFEGIVSPSLRVTGGASYNFTEIRDPSLSVNKCAQCTVTDPINAAGRVVIDGNPLPQAPKWTHNLTARWSMPTGDGAEFYAFTDWVYRSDVNFFLYESKEFTGKPSLEGGLRAGYDWNDGKYDLAVYGRNITNQIRVVGGIDFNNLTGMINEPRLWGVEFKAQF
jgi:iron complex outermembrane receptor protein